MKFDSELTINIQPIFNIKANEIKYAEVLMRPTGRLNKDSMEDIIRRIRYQNRCLELDKEIIRKACVVINSSLKSTTIVNINICGDTLKLPGVYKVLLGELTIRNVSHKRVVFEIHEDTQLTHLEVIRNIKGLSDSDIGLAIDDYGKGKANIQSIIDIPAKIVKFDKLHLLNKDKCGIKGLVSRLHMLGIDTVIEGVETDQQVKESIEIGYNNIQGYRLSRPINVDDYLILYT